MPKQNKREQTKREGRLRKRWNALVAEERPLKKRVTLASLSVLSLVFTVCFFGPVDLFVPNQDLFHFSLWALVLLMGLFSLALLVAISSVLLLLKGRLFDVAIMLVFALSLGLYLQGSFLNPDLGLLDGGAAFHWRGNVRHAMVNSIIWVLLPCAVFVLYRFGGKIWQKLVQFLAFLLVGMQLVALVSILVTFSPANQGVQRMEFSLENQFTLSANQNIVVLVLDYFSTNRLDEVQAQFPDVLDGFHDFTFFRNYSSSFGATFPSTNIMITGQPFDHTIPYHQAIANAWNSEQANALFDELKTQNYTRSLFNNMDYCAAGNPGNMLGKIDNLAPSTEKLAPLRLVDRMFKLSCYRYTPDVLKGSFSVTPQQLAWIMQSQGWVDDQTDDNGVFYNALTTRKIQLQEQANSFVLYHILGGHRPYNVNEFAQHEASDKICASRGALHIAEEYMAQMKSLGIYDNATIIITADHGVSNWPSCLLMIKRSNERHDKTIINQAPVTQFDFQPTLMSLLGIEDYQKYGRSFYDVAEDEQRERTYSVWRNDPNYPQNGHDNVIYDFIFTSHVDDVENLYSSEARKPSAIRQFVDSIY